MDFAGEFETHITVAADPQPTVGKLAEWARHHGLTCLHIVVEGAAVPSQPMLSLRGRGTLGERLRAAAEVAAGLAEAGFRVVRTKIEAAPDNRDVPRTDAEAAARTDGRYFEHHVKLLMDPAADCAAPADLASRYAARLSRNARRVRPDGLAERFVTQHCRGVGRDGAERLLQRLLDGLAAAGHRIAEVEREYVVFDSNADLDAPAPRPR